MKLYGMSLAFCVKDMALRGIEVEEVECIIAGTKIVTAGDFKEVLDVYSDTAWKNDIYRCRRIAMDLFGAGKVFQPRCEGVEPHNISNYLHNVWVEVEE